MCNGGFTIQGILGLLAARGESHTAAEWELLREPPDVATDSELESSGFRKGLCSASRRIIPSPSLAIPPWRA